MERPAKQCRDPSAGLMWPQQYTFYEFVWKPDFKIVIKDQNRKKTWRKTTVRWLLVICWASPIRTAVIKMPQPKNFGHQILYTISIWILSCSVMRKCNFLCGSVDNDVATLLGTLRTPDVQLSGLFWRQALCEIIPPIDFTSRASKHFQLPVSLR